MLLKQNLLDLRTLECVTDGVEALDRSRFYRYDLVVLDWSRIRNTDNSRNKLI